MGIEYNGLRSILKIKEQGSSLEKFATIGRQGIYEQKPLQKLLRQKGLIEGIQCTHEEYAEKLITFLGAKKVDSFDYSNYEHPTFVHDFNEPISTNHKGKYDVVFDGGSLEHIFNFPTAIKNCMEMVKEGGYFISVTTCNNFSGHGFYQFSPELFFRVLNKNNGFDMVYLGISIKNKWFKVKDPATVGGRVTFKNKKETYLIVIAKKESEKKIFETTPQQSDYVSIWNTPPESGKKTKVNKVIHRAKKIIQKVLYRYNPNHFSREVL